MLLIPTTLTMPMIASIQIRVSLFFIIKIDMVVIASAENLTGGLYCNLSSLLAALPLPAY